MFDVITKTISDHLSTVIVYITEIKYEHEHGRFPVGYYKKRRELMGPIRQDLELQHLAQIYFEAESE